jgi:A/G-specific adenine glycosylase
MASAALPHGHAAAFNQALMDLGAAVCTPRSPSCGRCPVAWGCLALARGLVEERPVRRGQRVAPHREVTAAVIRRRGKVLIDRRPEGKLLGGLWEFPGGKRERGEPCRRACGVSARSWESPVGWGGVGFDHAYTYLA